MTITDERRTADQGSADRTTARAEGTRPAALSPAPTTAELKERFGPVFARIAEGAPARERDRALPYEAVELLRVSGFTRVRLPQEQGGLGASLGQLLDLLVDLGAADSNLPQALHGHFLFTELAAHRSQGEVSQWWLAEVAAGRIFANALVELPVAPGVRPVTLTPSGPEGDRGFSVDGDKFYSTGSLFADYLLVSGDAGQTGPDGAPVQTNVVVTARQPGVELVDDWNGIGQRLTASGTTRFTGATVEPRRELDLAVPAGVLGFPLLWLILAATQAGIAHAALDDAVAYVRARRRTYDHASAGLPAHDPLVQAVVGQVSSRATAARSVVLGAARTLEQALLATVDVQGLDDPRFLEHYAQASVAASEASVIASELALSAATLVFDVGGASSLFAERQLDRHWRNARVLASHTPESHRFRLIGDHRINGTTPPLSAKVRDAAPGPAGTQTETATPGGQGR
jgi:alkylation response protein AidB-like acyl-CoA dehydrogenase